MNAEPVDSNGRTSPPRFVVVCNSENRRLDYFRAALLAAGCEPPVVVPYRDLLDGSTTLDDHLQPDTVLRIESAGEDFEVERGLLRLGAAAAEEEGSPRLSTGEIDRLTFDRGLIVHPRQAYLGFRALLRRFEVAIDAVPGVRVTSHPADVAELFDKPTTHARCLAAGLPVPRSPGTVRSYDELRGLAAERDVLRLFVKLANGSSASGVVALEFLKRRPRAVTSAEIVRDGGPLRLYNSLRLLTYTDERDVAALVDALCPHRVHVEEWLPKADPGGGNVDLRVVVVAGRAAHVVVRQSRSPLTNLHLGNRRGDLDALRASVPPDRWAALLATCERAAALYPRTLHLGIDVLPQPGFRRHAIAEINAFGDLLPGAYWHGMETYAAEVAAVLGEVPFESRSPTTPGRGATAVPT